MKNLFNFWLKQVLVLFLSVASLSGADMCYDPPVSSGGILCLGFLDIGGCKLTTPIRNISNSELSNVTVIKAYSGIDIDLFDEIGIDTVSKTPNIDSDEAEVTSTLNQYTNLNGLIDLNIFNKGVVYRTNSYAPSSSTSTADQHTIYTKTLVGFSLSDLRYLTQYTKDGITYSTRLYPCTQKLVSILPQNLSITEGNTGNNTAANFTVTLSSTPTKNKLSVNYTITPQTATQGTDYNSPSYSGTLTFNKNTNTLSQTISTSVIGDDANESNETYVVSLTSLSQAATENFLIDVSFKEGMVTIIDDDNGSGGVTPPISSAYANVDIVDGYSGSGVSYTSWINTKVSAKPNIQLSAVYLGNSASNPVPQAYTPSGSANQAASITILYKLADMSGGATCQNAPTVDLTTTLGGNTPVVSVIDPGETSQISNSFVMGYVASGTTPLVKKDVRVKYKAVDFNQLIDDSGIQCAQKSSTGGVVEGIPACLITNAPETSQAGDNYKTVFGQQAFDACYTANGEPCYASNGGVGAPPYDHIYGCFECSISNMPYVCSNDNFAIRPDEFNSTIGTNQIFTAGVPTSLTFRANKFGGQDAVDYNETEYTSFVVDVNISDSNKTCQEMSIHFVPDINFTNGVVTNSYTLSNVGDFNVTMHEILGSEFAKVDENDTATIDRLITPHTKQIKVIPYDFTIDGNLTNGSNGFTYLSNFEEHNTTIQDRNISASLDLNISARSADNNITSNYTAQCYAKDGNVTITLASPITITPAGALSKMIWYHSNPDNNGSVPLNGTTVYPIPFLATQFDSNETNGTAQMNYKINFDRNVTKVANPFMVVVIDKNVTDDDNVSGTNSVDSNATFLFGRTHAARQRYDCNSSLTSCSGTANIYFESYCFETGCNKTLLPNALASKQVDDVRWYWNQEHNILNDGNVSIVVQKGGDNISSDIVTATDDPTGNPSVTTLQYNGSKDYPYKTTMENNASNWLIQNEFNPNATTNEFQVEFDMIGNWTGEHETNTTTKTPEEGATTNRRIMW